MWNRDYANKHQTPYFQRRRFCLIGQHQGIYRDIEAIPTMRIIFLVNPPGMNTRKCILEYQKMYTELFMQKGFISLHKQVKTNFKCCPTLDTSTRREHWNNLCWRAGAEPSVEKRLWTKKKIGSKMNSSEEIFSRQECFEIKHLVSKILSILITEPRRATVNGLYSMSPQISRG